MWILAYNFVCRLFTRLAIICVVISISCNQDQHALLAMEPQCIDTLVSIRTTDETTDDSESMQLADIP